MLSKEDRKENEDLQQMYDRIVGSGPNSSDMPAGTMTGGMGNRQNSNSYQMQEEQSMGNGTLIFNPTINQ